MDYSKQAAQYFESSPTGTKNGRKARDSDSDTDFQERDESEEEPESEEEVIENIVSHELESDARRPRSVHGSVVSPTKHTGKYNMILHGPLLKADLSHSPCIQTRPGGTHISHSSNTTPNPRNGWREQSSG